MRRARPAHQPAHPRIPWRPAATTTGQQPPSPPRAPGSALRSSPARGFFAVLAGALLLVLRFLLLLFDVLVFPAVFLWGARFAWEFQDGCRYQRRCDGRGQRRAGDRWCREGLVRPVGGAVLVGRCYTVVVGPPGL